MTISEVFKAKENLRLPKQIVNQKFALSYYGNNLPEGYRIATEIDYDQLKQKQADFLTRNYNCTLDQFNHTYKIIEADTSMLIHMSQINEEIALMYQKMDDQEDYFFPQTLFQYLFDDPKELKNIELTYDYFLANIKSEWLQGYYESLLVITPEIKKLVEELSLNRINDIVNSNLSNEIIIEQIYSIIKEYKQFADICDQELVIGFF